MYRGKKNIKDAGRIVEVDGLAQMTTWLTDEANEFKGTDGYFTPPFLSKHEPMWGYERMLCVSMALHYNRKAYIKGIPMAKLTTDLYAFATDKGYCRKNGSCPIEGTLDLFNCMGAPIVATLPHFLDTHPSLLENVASGLTPKRKDHELAVYIDLVRCSINFCSKFNSNLNNSPQLQKTGIPLLGMKRLQFNFEIFPIQQVEVMQKLRSMIFPFAWIEERAKLPGSLATGVRVLTMYVNY